MTASTNTAYTQSLGKNSLLSGMMFLQFFIWGAWYVTMATYLSRLGFQGLDIGKAYSTTAWAAFLSPFLAGLLADKLFGARKVKAVLHFAGAALLFWVARVTDPGAFFWVLLLYTVVYMPTLSLANTVAMNQMSDPARQFPAIRVWGTLGWIAAGWVVGLMRWEDSSAPFLLAAGASLLLGLLCFSLPDGPSAPSVKEADSGIGFLGALSLFRDRSFALFAASSLLICIPLSFYYGFTNLYLNETGMHNAAGKMTFGQMSEIIFMVLLPIFLRKFGIKTILLVGMVFWAARYGLFMAGDGSHRVPLVLAAILFHGICYDFLFVAGQIYVDKKAPPQLRASAQGLIAMITYGLGMLIGSWASGAVAQRYTLAGGGHDWASIWKVPAIMALIVAVVFAVFFKDSKRPEAAG